MLANETRQQGTLLLILLCFTEAHETRGLASCQMQYTNPLVICPTNDGNHPSEVQAIKNMDSLHTTAGTEARDSGQQAEPEKNTCLPAAHTNKKAQKGRADEVSVTCGVSMSQLADGWLIWSRRRLLRR